MFLPSPGTLVADKYQLESLLGEGGMGAVYRARHVLMDKPVALKWLRPELCGDADARERLIREARSIARIHHPNVVQVFDVDSHEGSLFLVMELLEGQTFAELIAGRHLSTRQVIELLLSAMRGLAAAHERGIIHRDIKPENIFVVRDRQHPEGTAKLLDFGISKAADQKPGNPRLTQTGHSVGTPLYMSVEQLTRGHEVDLRTDIYALGVVLYHALSGELPFDGETFAGVVLSIATTAPRPLKQLRPELPAALDRIVMKAMARDRVDRYHSVDELITALTKIDPVGGHPSPPRAYPATRTPGPPPPGVTADHGLETSLGDLWQEQKASDRRRLLVGLAIVLALGAGTFGLLRRGPGRSAPTAAVGPVGSTPTSEPASTPTDLRSRAPERASAPGSTSPGAAQLPPSSVVDVAQHAPRAPSPQTATPAEAVPHARSAGRGHAARAARRALAEHDARAQPHASTPSAAPAASTAPTPTVARAAHDEPRAAPTLNTPALPQAATPSAAPRDTPSPTAPSKRNAAGGLLRGDF